MSDRVPPAPESPPLDRPRQSLCSSISLALALRGGAVTRAPANLARWFSMDRRPSTGQIRENPPSSSGAELGLDPAPLAAALDLAVVHGRRSVDYLAMRRVDSDSDSSDGDDMGGHPGCPLIQEPEEAGDSRPFVGPVPGLPDAPQVDGARHRIQISGLGKPTVSSNPDVASTPVFANIDVQSREGICHMVNSSKLSHLLLLGSYAPEQFEARGTPTPPIIVQSLCSSISLAIALRSGAIIRAPAKLVRWLSMDRRPSPNQIQENSPCLVLLDLTQVAAATASLEFAIIHGRGLIESFTMRRIDSPDSYSSDGNDDYDVGGHPSDQHHGYPLIQSLEVGDARLFFVSGTVGSVQGLPDAPQGDLVHRLSDVHENSWILKAETETFADPRKLTNETTQTWIMRFKITTKLVGLSKQQLPEQNWEQYILEIAGQPLEQLIVVACSFTNAIWSEAHISQMLTVFDALVDVLFNIQDLPFSRSGDVAGIVNKMVNAFKGVIQGTPKDIRGSKESTIHPATFVLIQVLQFFCRNRDMVQSILATGDSNTDPCSDIFSCLISKLMECAESSFQEKGQRYIFILNNIYYVQQKDCHPGLLPPNVMNNLVSLVDQYTALYLGEYWVQPMLPYLDGDSLKKPRHSSVDTFIEKFYSMCNSQMTWKVQTELRGILRKKIVELIVPKYVNFVKALQERRSSHRPSWLKWMSRGRSEKPTAEQLEKVIQNLYEG